MSKEHQLPSDSDDDDDEDYVPDGADNEPVSEVDSEGEVESGPEDENDENKRETDKTISKKRRNQTVKDKSTKRKKRIKRKLKETDDSKEEEEEEDENKSETAEKKELTEEEEKKRADSLWADFMKDTAVASKPKQQSPMNGPKEKSSPLIKPKVEEKVKITKIFEFAGEEVKIEKEVSVDSAEARLSLPSAEYSTKTDACSSPAGRGRGRGGVGRGVMKRGGLGGISSVLGQIGKKAKISTLEKSKLDWDNYKKQENIEEEIVNHNRGKDGYLERQDFLQRADLRQFEIEKQLRNTSRRSTR
ncbi:PREDICTED: craniofacial development protein 1 [Polistes dominula]|uniref:Craniofacial development protein 1 n=1 Tax=Polistes dominula TaxID=743375 RepID=A0ABM1IYH7_POLDO|nr:PREDICTED: craniofacial development protein 1 [Polistes dominula]